MSNLAIVVTCVLISFISCAIFMSAYKEEMKDDKNEINTRFRTHLEILECHSSDINILRARMTDLENKTKEMEKLDDGK